MVSGIILGLAVGIAGLIAVGWLSKRTQAGAGIAELGAGISSFLSPQITPTFKPMVEIGIGPNVGGLIQWLQDSWGSVSGEWGADLPKIPAPILPKIPSPILPTVPIVPKIPSSLLPIVNMPNLLDPGTWAFNVNTRTRSPLRMYGIDGSRL